MRAPWDVLEPAARGDIEREERAVGRVERLTGIIFAVAMALLVLNLVVPQLEGQPTDAALRDALVQMVPAFFAFVLSFVLLLTCWVLHHFQFHYFMRTSTAILWTNAALMLSVALVPFTTALVSTYSMTRIAVVLYEANLLVMQVLLLLNWRQAVKTGLLFGGNVPAAVVRRMRVALTVGTACVLAAMPLAWISPYLSLGLLVGLAAFYIFLTARGGYTLDAFRRRTTAPPMPPWPI
ncbi:TMEM175 family protein [Chloroflexota bacterium]